MSHDTYGGFDYRDPSEDYTSVPETPVPVAEPSTSNIDEVNAPGITTSETPVPDQTPSAPSEEKTLAPEVTGVSTEKEDTSPEEAPGDVRTPYARRRTMAVGAGVGLVALLVVFMTVQFGGPSKETTPDRADATVAPPDAAEAATTQSTLSAELDRAAAHQAATGSFKGFVTTLSEGKAAAGVDTLVISAIIDGNCSYSGIIPGQDRQFLFDSTGEACTQALIDSAQAEMDTASQGASEAASQETLTLLSEGVENVQFYAMNNFVGGVPSFENLPGTMVEGVTVTTLTTDSVTLEARSGESCQSVTVTWDNVSDPRSC